MSIHRRLALRLMDHATSVMPTARKDWAEAMRAEFSAMPTDHEALAWASGCVWVCYCERVQPMDVLVKSLVRAFAAWLVVFAFLAVMILLHPMPAYHSQLWKLVRILSEFYGGMFATLWVCELFIARFWNVPDKIFKKTLLRATALWLWPLGLCIFQFIRLLNDPVAMNLLNGVFWKWLPHWLINWVTHYPVMFVAMFVPLYVSERLIARYWRARQERAA